ncbi:IMP cyclohydrolase [Thiospirochaeta perfilievii]|uniref:IMP cyclohydrolase n=1 Tax=Thiospirochaeta perfilievii TaxID=252967 RepID=A0A5C1QJS0_9SPIO|nr:IMP cyclohydrolase [Thiospirochaeta perfilievii]
MKKDLKQAYKTINSDSFPKNMEVSFFNDSTDRQTMLYEKVTWSIDGEEKGLRYGENPCQPAALYKLVDGNLNFGDVETIKPGNYLGSDVELLQSGKHPGKINIADIDSALNILRYMVDKPATIIIKHNNPCGVAIAENVYDSYYKALMADRIAAFGGAIAVNRELDLETAKKMVEYYHEVIIAPSFADGVLEVFASKKNLRVVRVKNIEKLQKFAKERVLEVKAMIDGGMMVQYSYTPQAQSAADFLPAETTYKGTEYKVNRKPTEKELEDMIFGWLVEAGVTSNSVIYVKDGATVGIGTGEQDRVGVAEIAIDKAYRKLADRKSWEKYQTPFNVLEDKAKRDEILKEVENEKGGLIGSVMISDAFFPFRDGVDIGLKQGVTAIVQPGGSIRDFEAIEACNEYGATMVYTGQRSFRH